MADTVSFRAFKGLRNDVSPERFEPTDLAAATNVDIDSTGRLSRRDGLTLARAGGVHSLWADGDVALFVEGSSLMRLLANYSAVTVRSGLTVGARMAYMREGGRVYYSNGRESGIFEIAAGTSRSWGLDVPLNPGSAAVGSGAMHAGRYQYTVLFIRSDGQESGAPLARTIDVPEGGAIQFSSLPVSTDPTAAYKAIYLSAANGETLYRALILPNAATTATYANDCTELHSALQSQFLTPPPPGHIIGDWPGYLFVGSGNLIFPSRPYAFELFDAREFMPLDSLVTLIAPVEDGIYVASLNGTWFMTRDESGNFSLTQKATYGAIPGTLAYQQQEFYGDGSATGPVALWTSPAGICSGTNGGVLTNLTGARYKHSPSTQGCALVRSAAPDIRQYLVSLSS